jgi:hypothetical protein
MSLDPQLAAHAVAAAGDVIVTLDRSAKVTSGENGAAAGLVAVLRPAEKPAVEFVPARDIS